MSRKNDKKKIQQLDLEAKLLNQVHHVVDRWTYDKIDAQEAIKEIANIIYCGRNELID